MKILYSMCLFIILINVLPGALSADDINNNEFCSAARREEQQCGSYTFKVVKPLLDHLRKIQDKLDNNDKIMESKDGQIKELQIKVAELPQHLPDNVQKKIDDSNTANLIFLKEAVAQLTQSCQLSKNGSNEMDELIRTVAAQTEIIKEQNDQIKNIVKENFLNSIKMRDFEQKFAIQANSIKQKDELISDLQTQQQYVTMNLSASEVLFQSGEASNLKYSCAPFADSPGVHKIQLPGPCRSPFNVLCGSAGTDPGWIIIQQRINGKEDFYRDWDSYRNGFGLFNGDFFLGLEKIYRLTSHKRHELYIYLERFNGTITYATYNEFAISGEDDQYRLISAEGYSGNTGTPNYFGYHKGLRFYTYDRDNENGCAKQKHGGWWYHNCANCNLNGKYFDHEAENNTSNYWYNFYALKKIQMLIRPVIYAA